MTTEEQSEQLKKIVTSFPYYLNYVYKHIGLNDSTKLQQRIAYHMGLNPDRLILEAARGVGKSWIGAIYTTWRLLRNQDEKVLVLSASAPKAIEIATFIKGLFTRVPILFHLQVTDGRDSVQAFDVAGCKPSIAPSVAVSGIGGQIVGKRASLILADDIEVPANSATELMREKLKASVSGFEDLLIPDMDSSIIFLGTPQSMESVYVDLPYHTTILPAEVPEDISAYMGKLDPWIMQQGEPGTATDLERFPAATLNQRKSFKGLADYKLQYMLDTTMSDAERFPLKFKDMIVYPTSKVDAPMVINYAGAKDFEIPMSHHGFNGDRFHRPLRISDEYQKYDKIVMGIDPSGLGTDETSYAILGILSGNVFVLDWGGYKGDGYSDETMTKLSLKALEYKVNEIVPEANFGDGMWNVLFKKTLYNYYNCHVEEGFKVKSNKEARIIDNILPLLANHHMIFNQDRVTSEFDWVMKNVAEHKQYSMMFQLSHITYEKGSLAHDDRLDALALACQYIADMVIVSAESRLEDIKQKELEQFLIDKVYNNYNTNNTNNYINKFKR